MIGILSLHDGYDTKKQTPWYVWLDYLMKSTLL